MPLDGNNLCSYVNNMQTNLINILIGNLLSIYFGDITENESVIDYIKLLGISKYFKAVWLEIRVFKLF